VSADLPPYLARIKIRLAEQAAAPNPNDPAGALRLAVMRRRFAVRERAHTGTVVPSLPVCEDDIHRSVYGPQ